MRQLLKPHIIITMIVFLLLSPSAFSQTIVTGQVKSTNDSLSNASVIFYENDKILSYTYTNEAGFYSTKLDDFKKKTSRFQSIF